MQHSVNSSAALAWLIVAAAIALLIVGVLAVAGEVRLWFRKSSSFAE